MKLLTKAIEKQLLKNAEKGVSAENTKPVVKYFGGGAFTALIIDATKEPNGDYRMFGAITHGHGYELGYIMMSQLKELRFPPFRLPVERDMYTTFDKTLMEIVNENPCR